jgi:hypothetical protein
MISINFNRVFVDTNIALGNHMFQYTICRIISLKNNYGFFIPDGGYLVKCFNNIDLGVNDGSITNYFSEDISKQLYDPNIFNIPNFTNLKGFFQTDKYFKGYEELVKSWFAVDMDDETNTFIEKYPVDDYCYIHIRGIDYKDAGWVLPEKYFNDAMKKVKKVKNNISFVIITDDIEYSKKILPNIDILSNNVVTDFKLLYNSKYSIISNSSFSWWSSWLTDKKITVAPLNWLYYNEPSKGFYPMDVKTDKFIYI